MKKFFVIFLTFILVFGSCFSSFADTSSNYQLSYLDNTISTLYGSDYLTDVTYCSRVYRSGSTNTTSYFYAYSTPSYNNQSSTTEDVYMFLLQDANTLTPVFVCDGQFASGERAIVRYGSCDYSNSRASQYQVVSSTSTYNSELDLTYHKPAHYIYTNSTNDSNIISYETYYPVFTSIDDGISAVRAFINSQGVGTVGQFYIPAGYACYMGSSGGYISLNFHYSGDKNYMFATDNFPMNIRLGSASSLPSSSIVFNQNFGQALTFTAVRPFNILGQSRSGYYRLADVRSFLNGNSYVVIYNPLYDNKGNANPSLLVNSNQTVTCFLYPLSSTGVDSNQQGELSDTDFYMANNLGQSDTVNFDHYYVDVNSGDIVSDSAISIPIGGNTSLDDPDDNLDSFMDKIISIFTAPVRHIQRLFASGTSFMSWLQNLYLWFPEEVRGVLSSALVVLVVVGAVKLLWK